MQEAMSAFSSPWRFCRRGREADHGIRRSFLSRVLVGCCGSDVTRPFRAGAARHLHGESGLLEKLHSRIGKDDYQVHRLTTSPDRSDGTRATMMGPYSTRILGSFAVEVHRVPAREEKGLIDHLFSFLGSAIPLEPFTFLAKTLPKYLKTILHVVGKGPRFGKTELRAKEPSVPATAAAFYVCGIAVCVLLIRPILRRHGLRIDWIPFILESLYLQMLALLVIHFAAKLAKGKGTLTQTLRAYGYWVGMILPLVLAVHYSVYWLLQARALPNRWHLQLAGFGVVLPHAKAWWLWASYAVMMLLVVLFAWHWLLQWLSDIHRAPRRRIATSLVILLVPITYLQLAVMRPYVVQVFGSTAGYIRAGKQLVVKEFLP
jgi:hypothetical protein